MKMSKWAVYSARKTGAQQPFKWSTSVLWQVSHLCQRTVDVKIQSSFCKNRIYAIKDDTNLQIQKKTKWLKQSHHVIKWQQNISALGFWCPEAMSAPPQHGGGQQCKKRSKSRVHQASVCSKVSVSESFPARATSRKKKLSPTSRRGGYHFFILSYLSS